jgi:8-oxo-dGTP diphosphatase
MITTYVMEIALLVVVGKITPTECQTWMQRRSEDGPLDGAWEFPGGKVEAGESAVQAALREFKEEVGVEILEIERVRPLTIVSYEYSDRKVNLNVMTYFNPDFEIIGEGQWQALKLDSGELVSGDRYPEANQIIHKRLCDYINKQKDYLDYLCSM